MENPTPPVWKLLSDAMIDDTDEAPSLRASEHESSEPCMSSDSTNTAFS